MTFCCVPRSSPHLSRRSTALSQHSTNTWSELQLFCCYPAAVSSLLQTLEVSFSCFAVIQLLFPLFFKHLKWASVVLLLSSCCFLCSLNTWSELQLFCCYPAAVSSLLQTLEVSFSCFAVIQRLFPLFFKHLKWASVVLLLSSCCFLSSSNTWSELQLFCCYSAAVSSLLQTLEVSFSCFAVIQLLFPLFFNVFSVAFCTDNVWINC